MTDADQERIVVGVDGSDASYAALRWAIAEARLRNVAVLAVHAWQYPYVGVTGFPVDERVIEGLLEGARETLARAMTTTEHEGVRVDTELVNATAAEALLDAAKDAVMLVVGSRGHGGFSGLLLGSVSQACVHHATCPVVVVRS